MNKRVNPLTNTPGGVSLRFLFGNGKSQTQERVKFPEAYIKKVADQGVEILEVTDITNNKVLYKK